MAVGLNGYQAAVDAAATAIEGELERIGAEAKRLTGMLAILKAGAGAAPIKFAKPIAMPKAIKPVKTAAAKPKRTRRSSEAVKAQAMEMAAFVKSKGKEGVSGKEIAAKFGPVLPSIKNFVNERVEPAFKIKSKGAASKTVYFV